ncbi:MAG TPA: hypothetical protein VMY42_27695 [Thermoguttaceae bacterium]|nr:hypothetical protein [Thermoguttaceae bacterium]
MSTATVAAGYDFFGRARYPGAARRVEGVDLYQVDRQGGPHAEGYQRRAVEARERLAAMQLLLQEKRIGRFLRSIR